jgi:hypothetical protein
MYSRPAPTSPFFRIPLHTFYFCTDKLVKTVKQSLNDKIPSCYPKDFNRLNCIGFLHLRSGNISMAKHHPDKGKVNARIDTTSSLAVHIVKTMTESPRLGLSGLGTADWLSNIVDPCPSTISTKERDASACGSTGYGSISAVSGFGYSGAPYCQWARKGDYW